MPQQVYKKQGLNLLTCYKPHEWRLKLLQMALQIEICSTTERHWKIGTSGNGDSGTARLFFAGIANSPGRGASADER